MEELRLGNDHEPVNDITFVNMEVFLVHECVLHGTIVYQHICDDFTLVFFILCWVFVFFIWFVNNCKYGLDSHACSDPLIFQNAVNKGFTIHHNENLGLIRAHQYFCNRSTLIKYNWLDCFIFL